MPEIRKRTQKAFKKKHKRTIKRSLINLVWRDFCEHGIIGVLLDEGKVQVDKGLRFEIVGRRVVNDPNYFSLLKNGFGVTRYGGLKQQVHLSKRRPGVFYKIRCTESNYKAGQLIFKAHPKFAKRVHERLSETSTYYRIEA